MTIPEYLLHFADAGAIPVEVKVTGGGSLPIRRKFIDACDIVKLLASARGGFIRTMTFDERPYEISKFVIHPSANKLTIWVNADE